MKPDIERQVEELLDIEGQEILINKVEIGRAHV